MKTYWILSLILASVFLGGFFLAEGLEFEILVDPSSWLASSGWVAAGVGFALLVSDVLLPVPASLVMIAHGALFGFVVGTLLSLCGALAASAFGFALGKWGAPLLGRVASDAEQRRANSFLKRWGALAVIVSRPVPIVAETVAVVAGTSTMSWRRFLIAAVAGSVPAAALYAVTGAWAVSLDSLALVFTLVLVVAGAFWGIGRLTDPDEAQ